MATESKKIRRDDFVKKVRPDPKTVDELQMLQGYIGDSDLPGHIRVYSDTGLNNFIDIPEGEVLHSANVDTTENPLGGSRLWVRKSTVFTTGDPRMANRAKSTFLEGDMYNAYRTSVINQRGTGDLGITATQTPTCISIGNTACITNNPPCDVRYSRYEPACTIVFSVAGTCGRTCLNTCNFTCFNTCNLSCGNTCFRTCGNTCNVWCSRLCTIAVTRTEICELEVTSAGCTVMNPGNPVATDTFRGAFNPYGY